MFGAKTINDSSKKLKIREGYLVKVEYSPSVKVSSHDPAIGHLIELSPAELADHPVVGIVTKVWGTREFEIFSSGEFFVISTNNGFEDSAINLVG